MGPATMKSTLTHVCALQAGAAPTAKHTWAVYALGIHALMGAAVLRTAQDISVTVQLDLQDCIAKQVSHFFLIRCAVNSVFSIFQYGTNTILLNSHHLTSVMVACFCKKIC